MNPEISRRCSSCGASIRERDALFCPECGKPLPASSKPSLQTEQALPTAQADEALVAKEAGEIVAAPPRDQAIKATDAREARNDSQPVVTEPSDTTAKKEELREITSPRAAAMKPEPPRETQSSEAKHVSRAHPRMEKTRETLHRASTVARGVIEDEVKRMEKIRHVSSVVIEEASYDPSLRFVLVALGLFILFLILLVISKVMG